MLTLQKHKFAIDTANSKLFYFHFARDVKESDKGWYMCQINTDPMKSQLAYLDVVGEYGVCFRYY